MTSQTDPSFAAERRRLLAEGWRPNWQSDDVLRRAEPCALCGSRFTFTEFRRDPARRVYVACKGCDYWEQEV